MSTEPETVTFIKVVPIADADGKAIRVGSVLRHEDGERGVVVRIVRLGDSGTVFDAVGDLNVWTGPGSYRCSNNYSKWRHIPKEEQTYEERYVSWKKTPFNEDLSILMHGESISKDERIAVDGIMALLPSDIVDWEYGPWPDDLEQALHFLQQHLSKLSGQDK